MKKLLSLLLCLCMAATLLPATVLAAGLDVKYIGYSVRFNCAYYVIYEINGETVCSDEMGLEFNAAAWDAMSDEDKLQVCKAYNIGYRYMKAHFGEDKAKKMNAWAREETGWTDANERWQRKVANKAYPTLIAYFTDGGGREGMGSLGNLTIASQTLPELLEYKRLLKEFNDWFTVGTNCTAKLATYKAKATSIAVTFTSKELIKLIMDNAMLGKPTGLVGEAVKDQLWAYTEQLFNIKELVMTGLFGVDMMTTESAGYLISQLNEAMSLYERMADTAMQNCKRLRSELDDAYTALETANSNYATTMGDRVDAINDSVSTSINASVTPSYPEENEYDKIMAAYNAAAGAYDSWKSTLNSGKQTINSQMVSAETGLQVYKWPEGVDMATLPSLDPAELLVSDSGFFDFNEAVEDSIDDAKAIANSNIAVWETYQTACETLFSEKTEAFKGGIEPALLGVRGLIANTAAADEHYATYMNVVYSIDSMLTEADTLLGEVGQMQISGSFYVETTETGEYAMVNFSGGVATAIEEEERTYANLTSNLEDWRSKAYDALSQAGDVADEYLGYQTAYTQAVANYLRAYKEFAGIKTELEAIDWYAAQGFDPRGWLEPQGDVLNSVLEPLFDISKFRKNDGSTDLDARAAYIRTYGDTLNNYYNELLEAEEKVIAALTQIEAYSGMMRQLTQRSNGGANTFLRNLQQLNSLLKSEDEILLTHSEGDMANVVNKTSVHWGLCGTKLRIMMLDLYGNGYDAMRLRTIRSEFEAERSDLLRMTSDDFEARMIHWQMRAGYSGYTNPAYMGSPKSMIYTRSLYSKPGMDYYYGNFTDYGNGTDYPVGTYYEIKSKYSGFVPAEGLNPWGGKAGALSIMAADDVYDIPLNVGGSYDLSKQIYVLPAEATEQGVIWRTSDFRVATVDENGVVTGVSSGLATITAKAYDTPSTDNEDFTRTVVFKVGYGSMTDGWNIAAPQITVENDTATVTASVGYSGDDVENLICILALYRNGRMLGVSTCATDFELYPNRFFPISVTCQLPTGASAAELSAKLFRIDTHNCSPAYPVIPNE